MVEVVLEATGAAYTMQFGTGANQVVLQGTSPPNLVEPAEPYFFGFGAATGLFFSRHEVRGLTITFPESVCL